MATNGTGPHEISTCKLCGMATTAPGVIFVPSGRVPCRSGMHPSPALNMRIRRDDVSATGIAGNVQEQVGAAVAAGKSFAPEQIFGTAAKSGIVTERKRAVAVLDRLSCQAAEGLMLAASIERSARASGKHAEADQGASVVRSMETTLKAFEMARGELLSDPEACPTCKGEGVVPSSLAPGRTIPCGTCADAAVTG